jgi:predicted Rossmann fold flavoprotein
VVGAFTRLYGPGGVDVCLRYTVTGVERADGGFRVVVAGGPDAAMSFDAAVLTTGGNAFRHTGSTGDGYRFAASLGHDITPLYPSLNAYVVREVWAKGLSGLSFQDALLEIPARGSGARPFRFRGPFLFTHFGVTGPAVFALCSLAATEAYGEDRPLPLHINLMPDLSADAIDRRLQERFAALGARTVANALDTLLPRSICAALCELAGVDPGLQAARLPRGGRTALSSLIARLPLTIVGRKNGEEFVTAGGVPTSEVDPRTMASRLVPGLFFAGEILDVDGFTGGFNLQSAWATGRLAGRAAARISQAPSTATS